MINAILDPILGPLLLLPPVLGIMIMSLIISLITIFAYKLTTDQNLMKRLKTEIKELQNEAKELKNNPNKAMKVQTKMMETNSKYMSESMKPTLFTFIPIILIFGWLNSHMGYYPLMPNEHFEMDVSFDKDATGPVSLDLPEGIITEDPLEKNIADAKVTWILSGDPGTYEINITYGSETRSVKTLISTKREYITPIQKIKGSTMKTVTFGNEKVLPFSQIPVLQDLPWIGGWGWLGTYIIFSIFFSMTLRKLLKVY